MELLTFHGLVTETKVAEGTEWAQVGRCVCRSVETSILPRCPGEVGWLKPID